MELRPSLLVLSLAMICNCSNAFSTSTKVTAAINVATHTSPKPSALFGQSDRRDFISKAAALAAGTSSSVVVIPQLAQADVDIESFEKTGTVSMPMGVSGQAGKAKPYTGVVLREGSEVSRDERSGNVLAEILVGPEGNPTPILATFTSPWGLAKGALFDVETRDAATGDSAFLTVASAKGKTLDGLQNAFFTENLFSKTGRFSFYGQPTDIRVKKSKIDDNYRYLEIAFSNLSQSTNAEIPRVALVSASIPEGTDAVVMLVSSATASRFKNRGADKVVTQTVQSFKVARAPESGLKIRAKST